MDRIYTLLAGLGYTHPLHPPWTCIPIALVLAGLIFSLIAVARRYAYYARTARHCITLAFIGVFPTVLFGLMDWNYYHGGYWSTAIRMKAILAALLSVLLFTALLLLRRMDSRTVGLMVIYALSGATVVTLGWYGGEIVFGSGQARIQPRAEANAAEPVMYSEVQAIFNMHCVMCHGGSEAPGGLRLTGYHEVLQGAEGKAVVIPGKPQESELIRRVKGISIPRMPPGMPALAGIQIRTLEQWVRAGAPAP